MEKNKLVGLLCELNSADPTGHKDLPCDIFEDKCKEICKELDCNYEDTKTVLKNAAELYFSSEENPEWKYIRLSFFILHLINIELESQGEILSVQQSKHLRNCIKNIIKIGICTKLQPNLPLYSKASQIEPSDIFLNYNILKCTTLGLCEFLKCLDMRTLILPDGLKAILIATYQICYCPLKKPGSSSSGSAMTEDIYKRLMTEREVFLKLLEQLRVSIHPAIFVKETMVIFQSNAPAWFKKAISKSLTSMMRSKNGVEHIAVALFDGVSNDSTQTWKIVEVFSKIILSCRNFPDFEENICCQLVKILDKVTEETPVFERIFTHCTKTLYQADRELTENIFLKKILSEFSHFTSKDHIFDDGEVVTKSITQKVRLCHALFVENSQDSPSLPLTFLTPSVSVIFRLYAFTLNTSFKSTNNELREILIALLNLNPSGNFQLFDSFLFGISSNDIPPFKNDIILKINQDDIVINHPAHAVSYSSSENSDCILKLLENKPDLLVIFFGFLLNCLSDRDKYFKKANEDLLSLEPEIMSEFFERKLVVYKLLSELAEDKTVQKRITNDPHAIITYINGVLNNTIAASVHKTTNYDTDEFQSIFTTTMILQVLVSSCSKDRLGNYEVLRPALRIILEETSNGELQNLVRDIMEIMAEEKSSKTTESEEVKTELDQAIDDICDPLLPVRGHGLMTLMKLVERKDKCVMERKQYVLNIFQQNLKNDDSFIYLSAIGGLAAMGDVFPDTVLSILCEEYSDTSRQNDDGHEVRMKIGESLVRVTKGLGDMAPKYKSLLLNTFLIGTKDDDHLMRASSLSNLGEICRVLGYKLGTIITEVLVCVHAVIATDKAPEARRAAITVIRQLFVGLDRETLSFLKDDILPIYRTLKAIYTDDRDDVVRLQAQLALEELNENMRNFVFPKPVLNMEKKIIVLD